MALDLPEGGSGSKIRDLARVPSIHYQHPVAMTTSYLTGTLFLVLLLTMTGCGPGKSPAAHPLPVPPLISKAEPGQPGGRFLLAISSNPKTFNPLLALDSASHGVVRLLFSSLVHFDQTTQEPGPGLAESWSVASDQKSWTFKLRQGLRWSDGQPLTAEDVAFTWNEIMYNPQFNRITYGLFQSNGKNFTVTNVDALSVQVITPEVYAPFLEFFGSVPILPKHLFAYAVKQNNFLAAYNVNTPPARIVGSGPFRLKEFRAGRFTLLEPNPEFWITDRQGRRLPNFRELMLAVSGGPGTEAILFLNGKSDAYESIRADKVDQFKEAAERGRFLVMEMGPGGERDFIWFNQNTGTNAAGSPIVSPAKLKWFRNRKFRQAFSCAIDRDRIVRQVYGGHAQAAYGFVSTENPKWNNPNIPRYAFDRSRATNLLAEAGIHLAADGLMKDEAGNRIEVTLVSNIGNAAREKSAAIIQEDLGKIGINIIYVPVSFDVLRKKVDATFDYECALMGLGGGGVDPATQINVLRSSEQLHQWFPLQKTPSTDWEARLDSLMDAQMRTLDFAERKKAFDEVQVILAEELPMIYTVSPFTYAAIRSGICNVRPSVLTTYPVTWNIEELYFKSKN